MEIDGVGGLNRLFRASDIICDPTIRGFVFIAIGSEYRLSIDHGPPSIYICSYYYYARVWQLDTTLHFRFRVRVRVRVLPCPL